MTDEAGKGEGEGGAVFFVANLIHDQIYSVITQSFLLQFNLASTYLWVAE